MRHTIGKKYIYNIYSLITAIAITIAIYTYFNTGTFNTTTQVALRNSDTRSICNAPISQEEKKIYFVGCGGFF